MSFYIDLQQASEDLIPVDDEVLKNWAQLPLIEHRDSAELTLRIVDSKEMIALNHTYRQQNKTTNVLAFPSVLPDNIELDCPLLGDVIICPSVLQEESVALGKPLIEHWVHIVIHGVLHLLGYDHINESDALVMQAHEKKLLAQLGFADPYQVEDENCE